MCGGDVDGGKETRKRRSFQGFLGGDTSRTGNEEGETFLLFLYVFFVVAEFKAQVSFFSLGVTEEANVAVTSVDPNA